LRKSKRSADIPFEFTSYATFLSKPESCRTSSFGEHSLPDLLSSNKQRNASLKPILTVKEEHLLIISKTARLYAETKALLANPQSAHLLIVSLFRAVIRVCFWRRANTHLSHAVVTIKLMVSFFSATDQFAKRPETSKRD